MKAVVVFEYGDSDVLCCQDIDKPLVNKNQILIKTAAIGVNFADIKARKGTYPQKFTPPFIPGLDVTGIIEEVGEDVLGFSKGQRVIAFPTSGSYAEYTVADDHLVFPLPEEIDFETAAACPVVGFTAYQLLHGVGQVRPGESVLIHSAAGSVGTTLIQLAKMFGAGLIIGTVGRDEKEKIVYKAGADLVINYQREDFVKDVNHLLAGRGVDLILDPIAGDIGERSLECLSMYGRLVNFGAASGKGAHFQTKELYISCRSILGFSLMTTRDQRPELLKEIAEPLFNYLAKGKIKMMIGRRFSLAEANKAHDWIESRESTGKVILIP
jgi:NADPH:quinone reductase